MTENLVPERVREFITDNIDSIAEIEALLLLRSDPRAEWTVSALAQRLYTSEEQADDAVARLHSRGLLSKKAGKPSAYRYKAATPALDAAVAEVAETYAKYLVPVTNLIHSKQVSKVQQFADAFKLRNRRDE